MPLDIPVSSPSVSLLYKLESDDVALSLFLSTMTTLPNVSILLYAGAIHSAVCGNVISLVFIAQSVSNIYINKKVISNQLQQSVIIYNELQSIRNPFIIHLQSLGNPITIHLQPIGNPFTIIYNPSVIHLQLFTIHR